MSAARFAELHAFEAVARHGSFSAAARAQALTPGALTRRVQALEARLQVRLFSRSTRRVQLTEAGRAFLAAVAPALTQLEQAEAEVRDLSAAPRGTLRVSLPANFGRLYVAPHLDGFLHRWPQIALDLQFEDRFVDVVAEGIDVAVRIGALEDSRLVARRLADTRRVLVAAPAYLQRRGAPAHPAELVGHDCLHYTLFRDPAWEFHRGRERLRVPVDGPLRSNWGVPLVDAAVAGHGLLLTATFAVAEALADGRLVEVLADWSPPPIGVFAVFPDRTYRPAKVEAFVAFLDETLRRFGWPQDHDRRPRPEPGSG